MSQKKQNLETVTPSHKPIVWSLFAGGGTLTAFLTPILVFIIALAVPLGVISADTLSYQRLTEILATPLVKLVTFAILFLSIWHAAHRMRITVHDFGLRADLIASVIFYGIAAVSSIILLLALIW